MRFPEVIKRKLKWGHFLWYIDLNAQKVDVWAPGDEVKFPWMVKMQSKIKGDIEKVLHQWCQLFYSIRGNNICMQYCVNQRNVGLRLGFNKGRLKEFHPEYVKHFNEGGLEMWKPKTFTDIIGNIGIVSSGFIIIHYFMKYVAVLDDYSNGVRGPVVKLYHFVSTQPTQIGYKQKRIALVFPRLKRTYFPKESEDNWDTPFMPLNCEPVTLGNHEKLPPYNVRRIICMFGYNWRRA